MQILVVGTGEVGAFYAGRWAARGHDVALSFAREEPRARELASRLGARWVGRAVPPEPEAVLLAVRLEHLAEARAWTGPLAGRVLLDAVNPFNPERSGLVDLAGRTAADRVAETWPEARHVKALHSIGVQRVREAEGPVTVFLAGEDAGALEVASSLARDADLEPLVTGGITTARWSEPPGPLFSQAWSLEEARVQLDRVRSEV